MSRNGNYIRHRSFSRLRKRHSDFYKFIAARVTALQPTVNTLTIVPNHTTDQFTRVGHGFTTGDGPFTIGASGGGSSVPTELAGVGQQFYVIRLTNDTFQLAESEEDALAGTEITFTDNGSGTVFLRPVIFLEDIWNALRRNNNRRVRFATDYDDL